MSDLAKVYYDNAVELVRQERSAHRSRRINAAYTALTKGGVHAGAASWLANPFVRTALSILQSLTGTYKIKEAIRLLKEAGAEAEAEAAKKKPAPARWGR